MPSTNRPTSPTSPRRLQAIERQRQALELRKAGASFEAIAKQLGYADHKGAYKAVMSAIHKTLRAPAEEVRELELMRLDAMFLGLWRQAIAGDNFSVDRALKIMERRAALLGLDAPRLFKGSFDWRKEAQERGWNAADLFEQMVNQFAALYAAGVRADDVGSGAGSEAARAGAAGEV